MLVPVMVTATFAKTRPIRLPPVMVTEPPAALPARMFPWNSGGSVDVESTLGKGSIFSFTLPAVPAARKSGEAPAADHGERPQTPAQRSPRPVPPSRTEVRR